MAERVGFEPLCLLKARKLLNLHAARIATAAHFAQVRYSLGTDSNLPQACAGVHP